MRPQGVNWFSGIAVIGRMYVPKIQKKFSAHMCLAATVCRHEACVILLVYLFINLADDFPLPILSTGATDIFFPKVCIPLSVFCSYGSSFFMRIEATK